MASLVYERENCVSERAGHYKSPLLEISALRSSLPDEALSVLRYTIEPQISTVDKKKPWVWMGKLRAHFTGSTGSSLLTDRFKFWMSSQASHESIQKWEVKVRQARSLCAYGELTDELTRDKFIFGLNEDHARTELLKTHVKPDNTKRGIEWFLRAFASMRAVRIFLRARAVINFVMRAASTS